jgi:antitoxin PrlF
MPAKRTKDKGECCQVASIVSVDERGQMVLPKEVRDVAGIRPGDKLAIIMWRKEEEVCCMSLLKVDALTGMVKGVLGPLMKELV